MKRVLALLMCALLAMPTCALASEGDFIVRLEDDYVRYLCARGDELVIVGYHGVYTWKPGEAGARAYAWEANLWMDEVETDARTGDAVRYSKEILCAFADDGEAYVVAGIMQESGRDVSVEAQLLRMYLDAETVHLEEIGEIDWEPLTDSDYPNALYGCTCSGGVLYGYSYVDGGYAAVAVPLDGGYTQVLEDVGQPSDVAPYRDGSVLYALHEYGDSDTTRFITWNPEEEEAEEIGAVSGHPRGIAYDAASDRVFYVLDTMVIAMDMQTGEAAGVNVVPSGAGGCAAVLTGGFYACSLDDAVAVRGTDPDKRAGRTLTISCTDWMPSAVQDAYYAFANAHSDVAVQLAGGQTSTGILEAMLTRSADWDIYVLAASDPAFGAVYSRGYIAEIVGSEEIDRFFSQMYPDLARQLSVDGVPVAIPVYLDNTCLAVSTEALEQAGMTMDDIPGNWLELLGNLEEIAQRLRRAGANLFGGTYTREEVKRSLFIQIMSDYIAYVQYNGLEMRFDTDALRAVMEAYAALDFRALGLTEEVSFYSGGPTLLHWSGSTIAGFYGLFEPLLPSMTPDTEPVLHINAEVAFINPYSQNRDAAVAYLENVLENLEPGAVATLCDIDAEPVREKQYYELLEAGQQRIAELREALAEADEDEKQDIQEQIRIQEEMQERESEVYWRVHPRAIEWYRSHDDALILEGYSAVFSDDELSQEIEMFLQEQIGPEQLLQEFDRKLYMMELEGN